VVADDAYIRESIVDPNAKIVAGYGPTMPNYRAYLDDAQVDAILAYIKSTRAAAGATASETRILVIDPVCGMQVSAGSDTPDFVYGGTKYYFCSQSCLEKFQNDPSKYVKP
jgi:YHS domain-containing protein